MPANLAAFTVASDAARTIAATPSSIAVSPTVTTSTVTAWRSSTSAATPLRAADSVTGASAPPLLPASQSRSSRSCRRARVATSRSSPARRWISASVWRTESCRCAASSARSSERMRCARSSRNVDSRPSHELPKIRVTPASTISAATRRLRTVPIALVAPSSAMSPVTISATPASVRGPIPGRSGSSGNRPGVTRRAVRRPPRSTERGPECDPARRSRTTPPVVSTTGQKKEAPSGSAPNCCSARTAAAASSPAPAPVRHPSECRPDGAPGSDGRTTHATM